MDDSDDFPQLAHVGVHPDVLAKQGERFDALLSSLGWSEPVDLPAAAPHEGWRVLRRDGGAVLLGAPADSAAATWSIANLPAEPMRGGQASVHPDVFPLRPSRRERRGGLVLRWPETMRTEPDIDELVIDIVNEGDARWHPTGDDFHVAGAVSRQGVTAGGVSFGYVGRPDAAFALDPGEYARVRVNIGSAAWDDFQAGPYEVHAWLVSLGLRTAAPLPIDLDAALIERQRARHAPRRPPPVPRDHLDERRQMLRAMIATQTDAETILRIVADAASDEAARRSIGEALGCSETAADAVLAMQLRRFRRGSAESIARELDELEQHIEGLGV